MRRTMQASIIDVSTTAKSSRLKIGLLAAAVCAAALFVDTGVASADAQSCTPGTSGGNVNTCLSIVGSGLFVNEMWGSAAVQDSTRTIQVCLLGPDSALPVCTPFEVVQPGVTVHGTLFVQWFFNRNVTQGTYCAQTWRQNADGSTTQIGEECFGVHP